MDRRIVLLVLASAAIACAGAGAPAPGSGGDPEPTLERSQRDELRWMGQRLGASLRAYALDRAEAEQLARGLVEGASDEPPPPDLGPEERAILAGFLETRLAALAEREEEAGREVLARAAEEPGAVQTESGLVVKVLQEGHGQPPRPDQFVRVDFLGTLRDGTVFSTSQGRESSAYRLDTTMRCWQEALAQAAPGTRLELVCPSELGYGPKGQPGRIPGGSVLHYEIELLEVLDEKP